MLDEMVCYQKRAEDHHKEMQDLNKKLRSQCMMLQTMMSAMIPRVNAPANSHSNESKPTYSESCSADTRVTQTTNHKHNTRSRKDNDCKKVTFENTTLMFPKVNVPDNSHFNESASTNPHPTAPTPKSCKLPTMNTTLDPEKLTNAKIDL
jgi:hypothetical protein